MMLLLEQYYGYDGSWVVGVFSDWDAMWLACDESWGDDKASFIQACETPGSGWKVTEIELNEVIEGAL